MATAQLIHQAYATVVVENRSVQGLFDFHGERLRPNNHNCGTSLSNYSRSDDACGPV
jgi:hypothetical protein